MRTQAHTWWVGKAVEGGSTFGRRADIGRRERGKEEKGRERENRDQKDPER